METERICSVPACGRRADYVTPKVLCQTHYVRLTRGGDLQEDRPVGKRGPVSRDGCEVGGCTSPHYAKGYCNRHWREDRARRLREEGRPQR